MRKVQENRSRRVRGIGSSHIVATACVLAIAQYGLAGTLITKTGAPVSPDMAQADFSAGTLINWQDYSNNADGGPPGGPGQSFLAPSDITLNSITIKGFGDGGALAAATWTLQVGTLNYSGWDAAFTPLYNEDFTGDALASGSAGYVTFPLSTSLSLTNGTRYGFQLRTSTGYFGWAKSSTDVLVGGDAYLSRSTDLAMRFPQAVDRTFFLNGTPTDAVGLDAEWINNGSESWATGTNWDTGIPSGLPGTKVKFATGGGLVTTAVQLDVSVPANVTAPKLEFDKGGGGYLLSGAGRVTVNESLTVLSGNHTISAPTSIQSGISTTIAAGSSLTLDNLTVPGFGALNKNGDGALTADKIQNCNLNINGGTVTLKPGNAQANGFIYGLNLAANTTFNLNDNALSLNTLTGAATGTVNIGAGGVLRTGMFGSGIYAGAITGAGSLVIGDVTGSVTTTTLTGTHDYTGATTVNKGKLVISRGIQNNAALSVLNNGVLEIPVNGSATAVTAVGSITIAANESNFLGKIELHDNDLIVNYDTNPSPYAEVLAMVKAGLPLLGQVGADGTGITSAEIQAQTVPGTMLGVVDGGSTGGLVTSLSGFTVVNPTKSVLVKYTWRGDSNLDGVVNGSDYALADTGFSGGGTGWFYGDMNYDGVINGSDYALIDTGFSSQTGPLPEPAALSLLGLGSLAMLRRRRA